MSLLEPRTFFDRRESHWRGGSSPRHLPFPERPTPAYEGEHRGGTGYQGFTNYLNRRVTNDERFAAAFNLTNSTNASLFNLTSPVPGPGLNETTTTTLTVQPSAQTGNMSAGRFDPNAWYHISEGRVDDTENPLGQTLQTTPDGLRVFGLTGQAWQMQPIDNEPGRYMMRLNTTGVSRQLAICYEADEQHKSKSVGCMEESSINDNQKWYFENFGDGTYKMFNIANGSDYVLDVHPTSNLFMNDMIEGETSNSEHPAQHWILSSARAVDDGAYSTIYSGNSALASAPPTASGTKGNADPIPTNDDDDDDEASGTNSAGGPSETGAAGANSDSNNNNNDSNQNEDAGISAGAAAGIGVAATLASIALIGAIVFFFWRRRRANKKMAAASAAAGDEKILHNGDAGSFSSPTMSHGGPASAGVVHHHHHPQQQQQQQYAYPASAEQKAAAVYAGRPYPVGPTTPSDTQTLQSPGDGMQASWGPNQQQQQQQQQQYFPPQQQQTSPATGMPMEAPMGQIHEAPDSYHVELDGNSRAGRQSVIRSPGAQNSNMAPPRQ